MSKHSPYAPSSFERIAVCPGCVKQCMGLPGITSPWAREGSIAHLLMELIIINIQARINGGKDFRKYNIPDSGVFEEDDGKTAQVTFPTEMKNYVKKSIDYVLDGFDPEHQEILAEEKISLAHIHENFNGTADIQIIEPFSFLDVWDLKYGAGKVVEILNDERSLTRHNIQLVCYLLGAAHKHGFDFLTYRIGVLQPRARHVLGPNRLEAVTRIQLRWYEGFLKRAIDRTEKPNAPLVTGSHCHWCLAKQHKTCPKWVSQKSDKMFGDL